MEIVATLQKKQETFGTQYKAGNVHCIKKHQNQQYNPKNQQHAQRLTHNSKLCTGCEGKGHHAEVCRRN